MKYPLQSNQSLRYGFACILFALLLSGATPAHAQNESAIPTSLTPAEIERFLNRASLRTIEYTTQFRDLTADERQTVELYSPTGVPVSRRQIVSDFVVYPSRFDDAVVAEYRNVRVVNDVAVAGRDERVLKLFQRLAKTSSVSEELELIKDEASRYDLNYSVSGFTLKQALPLQKEVRSVFSFEFAGREKLDGHDVIVISYVQKAQHPLIKLKLELPSLPKGSEQFYRGRLWLDARSAQLRREEREVVVRIPAITDPLTLIRQEFYYSASDFGILVPRRITLKTLGSVRLEANRVASVTTGGLLVFEYGPFKRFSVVIPGSKIGP